MVLRDDLNQRYTLLDILGEGGTGTTYRARDNASVQHPDRLVAIKTLSLRRATDWKVIELFEREAQILAQIQHPQIPRYLDYFSLDSPQDRAFYIVQELAVGESLFQKVEQGWHATEPEVRAIAVQVLQILIYLHRFEPPIVHRDLKPHNLIWCGDNENHGQIMLVDFGAVCHTYHNTLMRGSTVVGTYGYMAPEQFRGQAVPATDLYGLGATLLFLLTGRSPADLPTQQLKIEFRSRIQLSDAFADWLEQLLEPAIPNRFASAEAALASLNASLKSSLKFSNRQLPKLTTLKLGLVLGLPIALMLASLPALNAHKYLWLKHVGMTRSIAAGIQTGEIRIDEYLDQGGDPFIELKDLGRSLIFYAIQDGQSDQVKLKTVQHLVAARVELNVTDNTGKTPLHVAAEQSGEVFRYLLSLGQIDLHVRDQAGKQALAYLESEEIACNLLATLPPANLSQTQQEIVKQVSNRAFEQNWLRLVIELKQQFPELVLETWDEIGVKAVHIPEPEILSTLLANRKLGAEFFKQIEFKQLPLKTEDLAQLIPDVNTVDKEGNTLLIDLALNLKFEDVAAIQQLIQRKARINQTNPQGVSPLLACLMTNFELEQEQREAAAILLIEAGANLKHQSGQKFSYTWEHKIKEHTSYETRSIEGDTALHLAASGYSSKLVEMLLQHGVNVRAKNQNGTTPLHRAVSNDHLSVIRTLLTAGANIQDADRNGATPLHYAVKNDNPNVIKTLLAVGANIQATDDNGATPLHYAVENNEVDAVKTLLAAGADVNSLTHNRRTPLDYLAIYNKRRNQLELRSHLGTLEIIQLLINAGAKTHDQRTKVSIR